MRTADRIGFRAAGNPAKNRFPKKEFTFFAGKTDHFDPVSRLKRVGLLAQGKDTVSAVLHVQVIGPELAGPGCRTCGPAG